MTHCAAAISSGGGGDVGGDGGGFSTPEYRRGLRSSRSDHCDGGACCCFPFIIVGYLVAFLLCITKMKPGTRVALVWFYCILGGGLGGVLLSQRYQNQDISASPLDQREVTVIPSDVFCQTLSLTSTVVMPSYLFDRKPVINTSAYVNYDYATTTTLHYNNYEYWGYFLLRASMVTVKLSTGRDGITLYIIKNKHNLNKYLRDIHCDDCYEEVHVIIPRFYPNDYSEFDYTASVSDDYYFVLANSDLYVTNIDIQLTLKRTRYDLNDGSLICHNETDCEIPLVMSTQYVVFDVPRFSPRDVDVTITYDRHVYLYIILFGLLPFMVGVFITLGILKHARRKELATRIGSDSHGFYNSVTDHEAGINLFSNSAAQMPPVPQKYAEHPPSYEQLYGTQMETG